jgi:dephospho-CoA kinase
MTPIIIGFSGKRGSGKSTLSKLIAEKYNCPYVSFGDYVRAEASCRNIIPSVSNLQIIGEGLMAQPYNFCNKVIASSSWKHGESLVIDGIRHEMVLDCLRKITSPSKFILVSIISDEKERANRLTNRGESSKESKDFEKHSTEQDVKERLLSLADLIISSNKPINDAAKELLDEIKLQDCAK